MYYVGFALIDCFVHLFQDMISLGRCIQQHYVCECMEIVEVMKQALLSGKLLNPGSYKEILAFTQIFKM
jgi:hypothetical protein